MHTHPDIPSRWLPASIGLISLASLLLEISLTRLFSVLFYPPAVFTILSLAVLGIGLGAAASTLSDSLRRPERVPLFLGLGGVSVALIGVVAGIPTLHQTLFVLSILPYISVGLSLTALFAGAASDSPRLYRADLVGAGAGAVLAIPLLNLLGGLNGVLAAGMLLAGTGLLFAARSPVSLTLTGVTTLLLVISLVSGWPAVPMRHLRTDKPIQQSLANPGSAIIHTEWDAFARTDLVDPGDGSPYRMYMDGAAGSIMPPGDDNEFLWEDIGIFPFATRHPEEVFVIGPGAGLDVWFALQGQAEDITAVEVNAASIRVTQDYAPYTGNIYRQPQVKVVIDEGRSVLQRQNQQYDLIFLSQVVTLTAERSGYALVENTTYTVEAFEQYLNHLSPEGQLAIKLYDEPTLTRALSTALEAFNRQGVTDQEALAHLIVLLDSRAQPPVPLLLIQKSPFSPEEALTIGQLAQQLDFIPLLLPEMAASPPLDRVASGAATFDEVIADLPEDFSPTTDDRPFFYQFEQGLPLTLRPSFYSAVGILLAGLILLGVGPWQMASGRWRWSPLYFAGLGMGFIMIEIGIIQKTRLFLGHPTLAITTVLATLLIGGGLGSGLVGRWWPDDDSLSISQWPTLGVGGVLVLWVSAWPLLSGAWMSADPVFRVLATGLSLLPLSLLMGMPFPLGLRAVGILGKRQVAAAWAINGFTSVAGSILAVGLAILAGFQMVLLAGGLAYVMAGSMAFLLSQEN